MGLRLIVGPGDETLEAAILAAAAAADAGLVRMIRGSSSLEDLFMAREATRDRPGHLRPWLSHL